MVSKSLIIPNTACFSYCVFSGNGDKKETSINVWFRCKSFKCFQSTVGRIHECRTHRPKVDCTKNNMGRHLTYLVLHLENGSDTRDKYESLRTNTHLGSVAVF